MRLLQSLGGYMVSRYSTDYRWASDADSQVVDPDDDASHPSGTGGTYKYIKGWIVETEPQEWENYVIKRREDIQQDKLERGLDWFDAGVAYKFGGIARYNNVPSMYIGAGVVNKILGEQLHDIYSEYSEYLVTEEAVSTLNKFGKKGKKKAKSVTPLADTDWTPLLSITKSGWDAAINTSVNMYANHLNTSNPHSDNITDIGGYTKAQIDTRIGVVTINANNHISLRNNPHANTPSDVDTLPIPGGNFTGRINYQGGIKVGAQGEVMFNSDKVVYTRDNDGAIGLGTSDYRFGGMWQTLFAENTYDRFEELYNYQFSMPVFDLDFNLICNTNGITFKRPSTLVYTDRAGNAQVAAVNEPAFEVAGLKLTADTTMTINATNLIGATECTIAYVLNGTLVVRDMHFLSNDLTYYFGKSGNVRAFKMWVNRLTPRQKKAITT